MKRDRVNHIIEKVYANRYGLQPVVSPGRGALFYSNRIRPILARLEPLAVLTRTKIVVSSLLFAILLIVVTAYYHNLLVISEQNMLAAMGQVQVQLQRRNDTEIDLAKAVLDYAEHEKAVLTAIVALRGQAGGKTSQDMSSNATNIARLQQLIKEGGAKPPAPGAAAAGTQAPGEASAGLLNLSALAEQYPDLKLSANFQTLMTMVDQIEKDLAAARMKQDDAVNVYTSNLQLFPSDVFALIFGFRGRPYFDATEKAKKFKPLSY